ncbi:MAG: NAD-dependent epimerase/dehydratase family protein [Deltaproteobacteria bacterium]|nr:NAD-dependent epimerase/dehydratase family protein [Deltaproteobacteria bacterium]
MAKKTLVTGAAGFIGSAVVRRLLARGREVKCYLEPNARLTNLEGLDVERIEGDVNDRDQIARALEGCDKLYHLAAIYSLWLPDGSKMYEVNVEGTKTVLWAAYKANLDKVVYTSSIAAVGLRDGAPSDETVAFNYWDDANSYIRSKWLSERDALRFAREGLPLVVVNPCFPFGERDIGPTPTGKFIVEALRGRVPGYMDGGFCAVDVEDVAEGHILADEKGKLGERYILGAHNVTYRDFYKVVGEVANVRIPDRKIPGWFTRGIGWVSENVSNRITHKPPQITYKAAAMATRFMYFDCSKAIRDLGLPQTPLRDSVERSVAWFRAHGYDRVQG